MRCLIAQHQGGVDEIGPKVVQEIESTIVSCTVPIKARSATAVRCHVLGELSLRGWSGEVSVDPVASRITIASVKDGVGLCLQTGNMARMYADILKLQKLYLDGKVNTGVMILPTLDAAKKMGDNIVHSNRLISEMNIFRKVIHMPIAIFSFEEERL